MIFNINVPLTEVFINSRILGLDSDELVKGYWYGITSIPSRMFGCHVTLENGANWSRIPIHALKWKIDTTVHLQLDKIQTYDCFSYDIQCIRFDFLRDQQIQLLDIDLKGTYLFTVDSIDPDCKAPFSELPSQTKTFVFIACEDGTIRTRSNNQIRFIDNSLFNTKINIPKYKRIREIYRSE